MARHILALIPARSGSRSLRHKNIQKVGGVPMLARAVQLARASARRGEEWRIVVSTDSNHYARIARQAGAEIPFLRPKRLATSSARLVDVLLHAITALARRGQDFDTIMMLSAATPLTNTRDVRRALRLHWRSGASVVSVTEDPTPDGWRFTLRGGRLHARRPGRISRRQQAPLCYRLHGAIYVATPAWLHRYGQFFASGRSRPILIPKQRSVDVEDKFDLDWAKFLCLRADNKPY